MTGHATIAVVLASASWAGAKGLVAATVFALAALGYGGYIIGTGVAVMLGTEGSA